MPMYAITAYEKLDTDTIMRNAGGPMSDAIELHALLCGGDVMDWAGFDPFDERVGTKVLDPYFVYVIKHPKGTVLFDSGAHPALGTDPASRLGDAADAFNVKLGPDDSLDRVLARIDLVPADIDLVIQSHLHFDHAGGLEMVKHAPVLVQKTELEFASDPPIYQREIYVAADFDHDLNWVELEGEHDVFDDGRLTIVPTPGHTAGHQSLLVKLDSQTVFLLADAAYLLEKMRARALPGVLWSPDAMIASWERIEELEREHDAFLIATHDLDYEERIRLAPDAHYE